MHIIDVTARKDLKTAHKYYLEMNRFHIQPTVEIINRMMTGFLADEGT
jgi:hypothetical protein